MPAKKFIKYKIGKTEIEADAGDKHAVRLAYINTAMYWLIRLLPIVLASGGAVKLLLKLIGG